MSIIQQNTPLEKYNINGRDIFVKREDLSSLDPAPRLSKLRGVYERMLKVKNEGYKTIGVFDTRVSKAGWGCAAIAQEIGDLEIINFYPELKEYLKTNFIPENQRKVKELGGKLCGMKGGRTAVLYSQSKKLAEMKGWYMMPLGLVVEESVKATSKIAETLPANALGGDLVVCIGSGMITAGIASALATKLNRIYAVSAGMDNTRQRLRIKKVIGNLPDNVILIKPTEYDYYSECKIETPFESSSYYDKKAFDWMIKNISSLKDPIIFWNIGC